VIAFVSKLNIDIYFFILVETPRTMPSPQIQLICGGRPCPRCNDFSDDTRYSISICWCLVFITCIR